MNFPKRRPGTGRVNAGALPGATASLPSRVGRIRIRAEVWEEACFEGNHENTITQRELGFKWWTPMTPPQK